MVLIDQVFHSCRSLWSVPAPAVATVRIVVYVHKPRVQPGLKVTGLIQCHGPAHLCVAACVINGSQV